jgi:hypothetical protein
MADFKYIGKVQIDDSSFYRYDWKEKDKQPISVIIGESKVAFYLIEDEENDNVFKTKNRDSFLTIHYHYPEKSHREIKKLKLVKSEFAKFKESPLAYLYNKIKNCNTDTEKHEDIKIKALEQFIWKLFSRNEFGESRKVEVLKETILKDKLLSGIKYKKFYSKLKPQQIKSIQQENTVFKKSGNSIVNESISDYWNFLLEDSNEIVIRPQYHGWFKSRESEILDILKSANEMDIDNEKELESQTIKLLLRRQNAIAALGVLFPIYTTEFIFIFLLISLEGVFICNLLNISYYKPIIVLAILSILFLIVNSTVVIKDFLRKFRALTPDIIIPRLIIAIVSGWILLSIDGSNLKEVLIKNVCVLLSLGGFMLVFLYKESRKIAVSESPITLAFRAFSVMFYGFVLSCTFGVVFKKNGTLLNEDLLYNAIWVLFISFFLQLLIQDKTPTESL